MALIVLGDGAAFIQQCRGLDLFVLLALQGTELENENGEVRLREAIARLAESGRPAVVVAIPPTATFVRRANTGRRTGKTRTRYHPWGTADADPSVRAENVQVQRIAYLVRWVMENAPAVWMAWASPDRSLTWGLKEVKAVGRQQGCREVV